MTWNPNELMEPVGGFNTPTAVISDEAVSAYQDAWIAAVTDPQWAAVEEGPVRAGLAAAAPLLVSAEAGRLRDALATTGRVADRNAVEVEGLRAELAEAQRTASKLENDVIRAQNDGDDAVARVTERLQRAEGHAASYLAELRARDEAEAALRAAGGQEKPNRDEIDRVARVLMAAWEHAEGEPVNVSRVATFADMARAALAAAPVGGQHVSATGSAGSSAVEAEPSDAQCDCPSPGSGITWSRLCPVHSPAAATAVRGEQTQ